MKRADRAAAARRVARAVLDSMEPFDPVWAGTFPLGLEVPDSDLDILCCAEDLDGFAAHVVEQWSGARNFRAWRGEVGGSPTHIARFEALSGAAEHRFAVEVFAQSISTRRQVAHRHLIVERRLLELGGRWLHQRVLGLKSTGVETEPAFARVLGLAGDPYQAVLELELVDDAALQTLVERARRTDGEV